MYAARATRPGMSVHDASKPGEFAWHELFTTDHEAAFRFYEELFGWERLGVHDQIRYFDVLHFLDDDGKRSTIESCGLPAP